MFVFVSPTREGLFRRILGHHTGTFACDGHHYNSEKEFTARVFGEISEKRKVLTGIREKSVKGIIMTAITTDAKDRYPDKLISPTEYKKLALSKMKGRKTCFLNTKKLFELAQTLLPEETIAAIMDCSVDTLTKHYNGVLQAGREHRKNALSQKLWHKALIEGDTRMLIWLSKQHLGYREQWPDMQQNTQINVFTQDIPK